MDLEFFVLPSEEGYLLAILKKENHRDHLLPNIFIDADHARMQLGLNDDEVSWGERHQTTLQRVTWDEWPWADYMVFAALDDAGDIVQAVVKGPDGILPTLCRSENEVLEVIQGNQANGSGTDRTSPSLRPRALRGS